MGKRAFFEGHEKLIIHDEYLEGLAVEIENACVELGKTYTKYIQILKGIRDNAITEGATHIAISTFIEYLGKVNGEVIAQSGTTVGYRIEEYIFDIDKKDTYLY